MTKQQWSWVLTSEQEFARLSNARKAFLGMGLKDMEMYEQHKHHLVCAECFHAISSTWAISLIFHTRRSVYEIIPI